MNLQSLNQKIIFKTGSFGFLMGIITVMGWSQQLEPILWLIIGIGTTYVLNKNIKEDLLLHCLIIGLCWGVDCTIVQALFFDSFLSNNPQHSYNSLDYQIIPAQLLIIGIGILLGSVGGTLLWVVQKIFKI